MKSFLTVLILIVSLSVLANPMPDLRGKYLIAAKMNINVAGFEGKCDEKSMELYAAYNYTEYGSDAITVMKDESVCESLNFNLINLSPDREAKESSQFDLFLAYGTGTIAGLFSGETHITAKRSTNQKTICTYIDHPWNMKYEGRLVCVLKDAPKSSITFFVD